MQQKFSSTDPNKVEQVRRYVTQTWDVSDNDIKVSQRGNDHELSFSDENLDIKTTEAIRQYAESQGLTHNK